MVRQEVASEVRGLGWGILWWVLAAGLHLAVLLTIIYWAPLRAFFLSREDPTQRLASLEGERLRRIVESLLQVHARRVREKVVQEQEALGRLQGARDQRYERYVEQTQQRGYSGPKAEPLLSLGSAGPAATFSLRGGDLVRLYEAAWRARPAPFVRDDAAAPAAGAGDNAEAALVWRMAKDAQRLGEEAYLAARAKAEGLDEAQVEALRERLAQAAQAAERERLKEEQRPFSSAAVRELYGLYQGALAIEEATYGAYRQMRAVELARIQGVPLLEASEATKVAIPPHVDVNWTLLDQPIYSATDGKLDDFKNELFKVHAEVGAMVAASLRMLDVAMGLVGEDVGFTVVFGRGGQFEGAGSGMWGSPVGPSLAPHEFYPGNTDGMFTEDFHPSAGRMLMDDGTVSETGWMYIDTWYIVGPFPNPERKYMDHKFPPESVIDLDSTYIGKDNLRLKWQFKQAPTLLITPPLATNYAVWYAYSEIYSDRDQDKFAAFGSDDYSKAWLNGELVWTSGKTPHRWIPDRGFRTLHLKKGYNSLLVKWENAGGTTGMSVMLYLGAVPAMTSGS